MGAHIVLHTARGRSNASVARETGLHLDSVRKWRGRFAGGGLSGSATNRPAPLSFVRDAAGRPGQGAGRPVTR
ncbi:hypothetical protein SRIMM317S_00444 [Streptomyces rimosus subsp. rimosus]